MFLGIQGFKGRIIHIHHVDLWSCLEDVFHKLIDFSAAIPLWNAVLAPTYIHGNSRGNLTATAFIYCRKDDEDFSGAWAVERFQQLVRCSPFKSEQNAGTLPNHSLRLKLTSAIPELNLAASSRKLILKVNVLCRAFATAGTVDIHPGTASPHYG